MKIKKTDYKDFFWLDVEHPTREELKSLDLPWNLDDNFLEDVLEYGHLPKIEKTPALEFVILRGYTQEMKGGAIEVREISNKIAFFIHKNGLLTIHRHPFSFLECRFEAADPRALFLTIVNELILSFEQPIQLQADKMDELERDIFLKKASNISIEELYFEKARARLTKKVLTLTQNVLSHIQDNEDQQIKMQLQDIKDTLLNFVLKTDETIEDANSLLHSFMSYTAQKSNDVMKLLTIFSAFFLPLTFIVGVYGMNFDNMPELRWEYAYFVTLGAMLVLAIHIYLWFKRRKIM